MKRGVGGTVIGDGEVENVSMYIRKGNSIDTSA